MTRDDTIKVLAVLKAAYPASYRNMSKDEANGVVMIWATQFAADPVQVVMMAVQKLIAVSQFPPSIAEVKSKLHNLYWEAEGRLLTCNIEMGEDEVKAVTAIRDACSRYNRGSSKEPTLEELMGGLQNYLITDGSGE